MSIRGSHSLVSVFSSSSLVVRAVQLTQSFSPISLGFFILK